MLDHTRRFSTTILAGVLISILLAGCAANDVDPEPDEPLSSPTDGPDPDGAVDEPLSSPTAGPDPDGAVDEPPAPGHDWDDLELEVTLAGGWRLRDCQGDAPLRCLHGPDGTVHGAIELLRFAGHDALTGADDPDRAGAALESVVADFDEWLLADRAAGCPQHEIELDATERTSLDGAPAIIRGHRLVTPQGEPVERSLSAYIADGGDLVLINIMATDPDGCTHVGELNELTPAELDHLDAELRALIRHGSIPRG